MKGMPSTLQKPAQLVFSILEGKEFYSRFHWIAEPPIRLNQNKN